MIVVLSKKRGGNVQNELWWAYSHLTSGLGWGYSWCNHTYYSPYYLASVYGNMSMP